MTGTLVDTGILVAFLDGRERMHDWVVHEWRALHPPLVTCEPVISETIFLLQNQGLDLEPLWELLRRKILVLDFEIRDEFESVATLMRRYNNLPMDLADACLVRMSEKRHATRVFTMDGDFKIYRRHGRQIIPLIFPD